MQQGSEKGELTSRNVCCFCIIFSGWIFILQGLTFCNWDGLLGLKACCGIRDFLFGLSCFLNPTQFCFLKKLFQKLLAILSNLEMETVSYCVSDSGTLTKRSLLTLDLADFLCVGVNEVAFASKQRKATLIWFWHPRHLVRKYGQTFKLFSLQFFPFWEYRS